MNELFPDSMIHLGGDEVIQSCFNENPALKVFMTKYNISNYNELIIFHMTKAR